ncbi:hypothetical protein ABZ569_12745 [Streptomyces albus]
MLSSNDSEKQELRADAASLRPGTPTVLAAVAAGGGGGGSKSDYTATKLSASSRWETDLNSGDLNWSCEMPVPDVPGGLTPDLGLAYSSGQIDGRTENTNNQSSWAGDGFEMWPGYIERKYKSCDKDGVKHSDGNKPADQCWAYDNAFLSFNGKGGELVPAGDGEWKLSNDDGTRIKRLASTERHNGDDDGEYWRLTDPDGTRYYFGYHRLPGWSSGKQTTDSTWTVPVFGNDVGEPCHASAFKDSWCKQAWRWNLDYVVETHGNAVAYYYDQEKNSYGRDLKEKDNTRYVHGWFAAPNRVRSALRAVYSTRPLAKVDFTTAERCLPQKGVTCAPDTIKEQAPYWYDTPWDLDCEAGEDCDRGRFAPSFWTRKRLTEVSSLYDGRPPHRSAHRISHRSAARLVDLRHTQRRPGPTRLLHPLREGRALHPQDHQVRPALQRRTRCHCPPGGRGRLGRHLPGRHLLRFQRRDTGTQLLRRRQHRRQRAGTTPSTNAPNALPPSTPAAHAPISPTRSPAVPSSTPWAAPAARPARPG